jgi:anti-anti-sigma factor
MEVFMTMRASGEGTSANSGLTVTVSLDDTVTTVGLAGELDLASESALEETAEQLRTVGYREVILDVARLRFCDVRGLAAILGFRRRMDDAGAGVTLRGASAPMVRLLRLTGLEELLDSDEDLAAAQ